MSKSERENCQTVFRNALEKLNKFKSTPNPLLSMSYIRELFYTDRCDSVYNLKPVRDEMYDILGKERLKRLLDPNLERTTKDMIDGYHATYHYNLWHEKSLIAALNTSEYCKHQFGIDWKKLN